MAMGLALSLEGKQGDLGLGKCDSRAWALSAA